MVHDDQFAHASRPPIVLTSEDRERLSSLKDAAMKKAPEVARFLLEELERADIVPPSAVIASPLVRMGSEVKFIDYATDKIEQVRLVYPEEADESWGDFGADTDRQRSTWTWSGPVDRVLFCRRQNAPSRNT